MLKLYATGFFLMISLISFSQKSYSSQLTYIEPCETSSIGELTAAGDGLLAVWPNPANDQLTIQSLFPGQIQIIDSKGQLRYGFVQSEPGEHTIDVREFAAGTYFIRLIADKQIYTTKIVVTHD